MAIHGVGQRIDGRNSYFIATAAKLFPKSISQEVVTIMNDVYAQYDKDPKNSNNGIRVVPMGGTPAKELATKAATQFLRSKGLPSTIEEMETALKEKKEAKAAKTWAANKGKVG